MIGPAVQIRTHAAVVDVGITALGHALQNGVQRSERARDDCKLRRYGRRRILGNGLLCRRDRRQRRRRSSLDRDVDEHEPLFVLPTEEVLEQHDVAELDRPRGSTVRQLSSAYDAYDSTGGRPRIDATWCHGFARQAGMTRAASDSAPHVRVAEERQDRHRPARGSRIARGRGVVRGQLRDALAQRIRHQELRQVPTRALPMRQIARAGEAERIPPR